MRPEVIFMAVLGRTNISSESLEENWKNLPRDWGHSLHRICSRTGSFPPPLAHYFVTRYSDPGEVVLDPFSGRGTVPLEACATGRIGIGSDAAPEAFVLTHAKVKPISFGLVKKAIAGLRSEMDGSKFDVRKVDPRIRVFFHPDTLKQVLWIREALGERNSQTGLFLKALMCGILHGSSTSSLSVPCSHAFSMTPSYLKMYCERHGLRRPRKGVLSCLEAKANSSLADPLPSQQGTAFMTDARKLPIDDETVDMIFTSPPYFEEQTYARDNWLRLWFLGYDHNEVKKWQMRTASRDTFLEFMNQCMKEMYRVLRDDSVCFIVLGDVACGDRSIKTANLLGKVALKIGFEVCRVISDTVPKSRKYFMFIPSSQGVKTDRIIELHKGRVRERARHLEWNDPYCGYLKKTSR
jgi:hypothetical protein